MGFTSKSGKHFANPAIGRQHDRDEAASKKPAREEESQDGGDDHGEVHKVEIHHPDSPENPSPGKHHTVVHYADGHEEGTDHESADEAHAHAAEAADVGHELGDPDEDDSEMGPETCPECGAEMEGGTCPNCGYSADKGAIAGQHEEESDY